MYTDKQELLNNYWPLLLFESITPSFCKKTIKTIIFICMHVIGHMGIGNEIRNKVIGGK